MSPKLIHTFRTTVTLEADTAAQVELQVPSQGQLVTVLVRQVTASDASLAVNVYDRADAAGLVPADSANPDDGVALFAEEVHRVVDTISGSSGLAKAYGLNGYYRNSDEKPGNSAFELTKLWMALTATVTGDYDIAVTVVGLY